VLFEALADGQTPGKRLQRLRVVRDGGYSVTFGASAVRNVVRLVDMQPFVLYGVGLVSLIVTSRASGWRHGAGTLVVKEDLVPPLALPLDELAEPDALLPALHTGLTDAEYTLLDRFIQRQRELDPRAAQSWPASWRPGLPDSSRRAPAPRRGATARRSRD